MLSGDLSLSLGPFVGPTVEGLAGLPAGDLGLLSIFASSHAGSLCSQREPGLPKFPQALLLSRAHSFTASWLGGASSPYPQDVCALGFPETTQSKQEYAVNIYNQPENRTQIPSLDGTQTAGSFERRGGAGRLGRWRGLPHLLAIKLGKLETLTIWVLCLKTLVSPGGSLDGAVTGRAARSTCGGRVWGADTGKERGGRRVQGWGRRQRLLLGGVWGGCGLPRALAAVR